MEQKQLKSFKDLKDLTVWQKAADLATLVYAITEKFPRAELYGLTNVVIEISKMIDGLIKSLNRSPKSYILNPIFFLLISLYSIFYILNPALALAVELFFEPKSQEIGIGQEFRVNLMIDTQGEAINAVAATIVFPKDLVEVKKIEDGSSILTLWVERPLLKEGVLSFAGVTPGGFNGIMAPFDKIYPGKLLTLKLAAIKEGKAEISLENVQVLLHDGKGTPAEPEISNFQFSIKKEIEAVPIEPAADITPPEPFTPEINRDPNIFEGKWFLVFLTQDKGSGIDYYEVCENLGFRSQNLGKAIKRILSPESYILNSCFKVESPYLLKDQELRSYIYVKAVDKAGNERIAEVSPRYPIKWYEIWWIWIIIIIIIITIVIFVKMFYLKR